MHFHWYSDFHIILIKHFNVGQVFLWSQEKPRTNTIFPGSCNCSFSISNVYYLCLSLTLELISSLLCSVICFFLPFSESSFQNIYHFQSSTDILNFSPRQKLLQIRNLTQVGVKTCEEDWVCFTLILFVFFLINFSLSQSCWRQSPAVTRCWPSVQPGPAQTVSHLTAAARSCVVTVGRWNLSLQRKLHRTLRNQSGICSWQELDIDKRWRVDWLTK